MFEIVGIKNPDVLEHSFGTTLCRPILFSLPPARRCKHEGFISDRFRPPTLVISRSFLPYFLASSQFENEFPRWKQVVSFGHESRAVVPTQHDTVASSHMDLRGFRGHI